MNSERKRLILAIEDSLGSYYSSDLLNDRLLDQLNLKQEDIKEVIPTFRDMLGYLYNEKIRILDDITVAGGSIGFDIITYSKGNYEIQPFLRYDEGHKVGVKTEHLNPELRVVQNNKEWYLPEKNGTNIFGRDFHTLELGFPFQWTVCNPDEQKTIMKGTVEKKTKTKPEYTKKVFKEEK